MTPTTDRKLREKMIEEKKLELKKTIEKIKQNTYEKKSKRNTIPEVLILPKESHTIKDEPIQKMETFGARPKTRPTGKRPCGFCGTPSLTPLHKCPAIGTYCNKCGKRTLCKSVTTETLKQPNSEKTNR